MKKFSLKIEHHITQRMQIKIVWAKCHAWCFTFPAPVGILLFPTLLSSFFHDSSLVHNILIYLHLTLYIYIYKGFVKGVIMKWMALCNIVSSSLKIGIFTRVSKPVLCNWKLSDLKVMLELKTSQWQYCLTSINFLLFALYIIIMWSRSWPCFIDLESRPNSSSQLISCFLKSSL